MQGGRKMAHGKVSASFWKHLDYVMNQSSDEPETPCSSLVVVTRLSPTTQPSVYLFSCSVDL